MKPSCLLSACLALLASSPTCTQADDLQDLLFDTMQNMLESGDITVNAGASAASDTDLNFTAYVTMSSGDVDVNASVQFSASKCDLRYMQATVAVDMVTPNYGGQFLCWLLGSGCGDSTITTPLYTDTFTLAPEGGWNISSDEPLNFVVTVGGGPNAFDLTFADIKPMFTGMNFSVLMDGEGLQAELDDVFTGQCTALNDTLSAFGIDISDLLVDDELICSILEGFSTAAEDHLRVLGLWNDPVNVGSMVANLLAEYRPSWLSADGVVMLGQNSMMCQLTPDPFSIHLTDVAGHAMDDIIADTSTIVFALVDVANDCLGGVDFTDYNITALSFDDIEFSTDDDGNLVLTGELWGGAGKNPAGILSCLSDNLDQIELSDGTWIAASNVEYEAADGECDGNEEYAQCTGDEAPVDSSMPLDASQSATTLPAEEDHAFEESTLHVIIGSALGAVVVIVVAVTVGILVSRRAQVVKTSNSQEIARQDPVIVNAVVVPDVRIQGPPVKTEH